MKKIPMNTDIPGWGEDARIRVPLTERFGTHVEERGIDYTEATLKQTTDKYWYGYSDEGLPGDLYRVWPLVDIGGYWYCVGMWEKSARVDGSPDKLVSKILDDFICDVTNLAPDGMEHYMTMEYGEE